MRQKNQWEQRCTYQTKGSKQANIFKQPTLYKFQTEKATNGSKASNRHGHGKVLQHHSYIPGMAVMIKYMQWIIYGDAQNDGAGTKRDHRNAAFNQVDGRQGKQCTKYHRDQDDERSSFFAEIKSYKNNHTI